MLRLLGSKRSRELSIYGDVFPKDQPPDISAGLAGTDSVEILGMAFGPRGVCVRQFG